MPDWTSLRVTDVPGRHVRLSHFDTHDVGIEVSNVDGGRARRASVDAAGERVAAAPDEQSRRTMVCHRYRPVAIRIRFMYEGIRRHYADQPLPAPCASSNFGGQHHRACLL